MWGVTEPNHTKANCNEKWMETFIEYFQFIEQDWEDDFQWLNNQGQLNGTKDDRNSDVFRVTQYIAMLIVWIGREDIPGSHEAHDPIDLFTYKTDGFLDSNQEGYNVGAILKALILKTQRIDFHLWITLATDLGCQSSYSGPHLYTSITCFVVFKNRI